MRCTANPGGVGGWWVKKMYIDASEPNKAFGAKDLETGREFVWPENHPKAGQPLFYRKFIPARLTDNPFLMADGQYEAMLRSLPDVERRRLLEGIGMWQRERPSQSFRGHAMWSNILSFPRTGPAYVPPTTATLRRRVFCGVLLIGIIIFGFIVNYT